MTAEPLALIAAGMVTGVGLTAPASCAAIRCGLNNFDETRFMGAGGEWIIGSEVGLDAPWRGRTKLAKMAAHAIAEALGALPQFAQYSVPILLCVAEPERPGRPAGVSDAFFNELQQELGFAFHPDSSLVAMGRVGGAVALLEAYRLILRKGHNLVVLAGVDSFLVGPTLAEYEERGRLLVPDNANGFVPGEASAAVVVARQGLDPAAPLLLRGLGFAREPVTIEHDAPLRGDGMTGAVRAALENAGVRIEQIDHRISDVSGEQYRFKELALALIRLLRKRKVDLGLWHPADCVGETGAAALPLMLGVLLYGARKDYLPGPLVLAHLSNDDDKRAALVLSAARGNA
jgi:3-oxoacyl-[acyl-carrier-protein] synthase-1